jgi:isopentenyl-diphosphate Delta-isomerase
MEMIDVLDPVTAEPTGERKPKQHAHRDGDWHRAVHVWIVTPDGRLLVQRRSVRKENHGGLWDVSAAGHVSAGEGVIETAIRETQEELGLELREDELNPVGITRESHVLNGGSYIDNEVHEVFIVRREIDLTSLVLQPEEVDDARLITPDELRGLLARGEAVDHRHEYELLFAVL